MTAAAEVQPRDHLVQFYEHESDLVDLVGGYLSDALSDGEIGVVVATPAHTAAFLAALTAAGADVERARAAGSLVVLDAAETLARFVTAGGPDPASFDAVIGELIRGAVATGRQVRAYGEMVALLWDDQQVLAAIELETLWNGLADQVSFSLLCAYPLASVNGSDLAAQLQHVCHLHSTVVGTGSDLGGRAAGAGATVTRDFAAHVGSAWAARRFALETLADWGREDLGADAAIVVTELAANAVVHARSDFQVEMSRQGRAVRISVRDSGAATPALRAATSTAESGRGLGLIAGIAKAWGHHPLEAGKLVWAELRV